MRAFTPSHACDLTHASVPCLKLTSPLPRRSTHAKCHTIIVKPTLSDN
jgi:hypothetical protein